MPDTQKIIDVLSEYKGDMDSLNTFVSVAESEFGPDWTLHIQTDLSDLPAGLKGKLDHAYNYYGATVAWNEIQEYLNADSLNVAEVEDRIPVLDYWLKFFGQSGKEVVTQLERKIQTLKDAQSDMHQVVEPVLAETETAVDETAEMQSAPAQEEIVGQEGTSDAPAQAIQEKVDQVFPAEPVASASSSVPEEEETVSAPQTMTQTDGVAEQAPQPAESFETPVEQEEVPEMPKFFTEPRMNSDEMDEKAVEPSVDAAPLVSETISEEEAMARFKRPNPLDDAEPAGFAEAPVVSEESADFSAPTEAVTTPVLQAEPVQEESMEPNPSESASAVETLVESVAQEVVSPKESDLENATFEQQNSVSETVIAPVDEQGTEAVLAADESVSEDVLAPDEGVLETASEAPAQEPAPMADTSASSVESTPVEAKEIVVEAQEVPADAAPAVAAPDLAQAVEMPEQDPVLFMLNKIDRQLAFLHQTQAWISARCVELGNIEPYTYTYYGFLMDVYQQTVRDIQSVLTDPAAFAVVQQKRPEAVKKLKDTEVVLKSELDFSKDLFNTNPSPLIDQDVSADAARQTLGGLDTSTRKEYLGPAPDGFEMLDDPYETESGELDEAKLKSDYEKIEDGADVQLTEVADRVEPVIQKNAPQDEKNLANSPKKGVEKKISISLGVKPLRKKTKIETTDTE